jgi:ethanolamine utilization protein EutN
MEVEIMKNGELTGEFLIAVDSVGAGIGETVLITTGSSARLALLHTNAPCDAVIVGIVDY